MRPTFIALAVLLLTLSCAPPAEKPGEGPEAEGKGGGATRLTAEQVAASVTSTMDASLDPCQDFYRYACGSWLAITKRPADKSRWGRGFSTIDEQNQEVLREILDRAAADTGQGDAGRLGKFYASCMDEAAVDKAGIAPLSPALAQIAAVGDLAGLMKAFGTLHEIVPAPAFGEVSLPGFGISFLPDLKDPTINIAHITQAGIGLPDRDYYFPADDKGKETLEAYRAHVARMLGFLGATAEEAAADAAAIVKLETKLAEASMKREELRDPEKTYHKIDLAGLTALTPDLPWGAYLEGIGHPGITQINVATPDFFKGLEAQAKTAGWPVIRAYLRWHLINGSANLLTKEITEASFEFYGKRLTGQEEMEPRWKRCVQAADGAFGDELARAFIERKFSGDSKEKALEMIKDIEAAFEERLPGLAWMDEVTRARALEKMAAVYNKIGYPDRWRDYSSLAMKRDDYFGNAASAARFEFQRNAAKVGGKVDKGEWFMTAPTVNAYYNPLFNEMVFPAGIMQPPFFHRDFPAAMSYGGIGMAMGHELTHGFDDQGRKFDKLGRLTQWWENEAIGKFDEAAACVREQYASFEVQPGLHLNGQLTLGENIADLGGIKQAYQGYKKWESRHGTVESPVEGVTADQLFFLGFAQSWCTLATEEIEKLLVTLDPHSPPQFRVNAPLASFDAFAAAFQCAEGTPMNPVKRCEVW